MLLVLCHATVISQHEPVCTRLCTYACFCSCTVVCMWVYQDTKYTLTWLFPFRLQIMTQSSIIHPALNVIIPIQSWAPTSVFQTITNTDFMAQWSCHRACVSFTDFVQKLKFVISNFSHSHQGMFDFEEKSFLSGLETKAAPCDCQLN